MHALISRLLPIALLTTGCPSGSHDDGGHSSTDAHSSTAHEHGSSTTGTTGHEHVTEAGTTHAHATEAGTTHEHATEAGTTHAHETGTTHEHATEATGDPMDPAQAYCECMVVYCHDDYHGTWGEDHEMSEALCQAEADGLPSVGMPAMSGNSLECRSYYCDLAMTDATACASAIGGGSCV